MEDFGNMAAGTVALPDVLAHRAEHDAGRPFLIDVTGDRATFAEARDRAERWAGVLRRLGVGEHDPVSTMLPGSVEATVVWIALTGLRAWEAPVHPSYHGVMLEHAVNTVRARTLVVHRSFLPRLVASADRLPDLRTVVAVPDAGGEALPFDVLDAAKLLATTEASPLATGIPEHELAAIIYT